ncbi:MAG TPA: transglycosylase domain-containing protein [Solirubrobacteraceae bacterium]
MSARLERQRRRRRRGGAARVIILSLAVLAAGSVIAILSAVGYVVGIANSAPDLSSLKPEEPGRTSTVFAADGQSLGNIQNNIVRFTVSSADIPQSMKDATVAIEDQRFYSHKGVDFEGIIRAAFKNAASGKTLQGGSTLTMQLIRALYPGNTQKTLKRKVREAKLAEQLENVHPGRKGKEWILTKYLNSVSYGTNNGQTAIGVQAASEQYFDKPASELTLAQSALLAGLPQAPSQYNPLKYPTPALVRRNEVLKKMAQVGFITQQASQTALASPLGLHRNNKVREKREGYFFDYVTDELIKRYGVEKVKNGGLTIKTTIDLDLQNKARASIKHYLDFPGAPSSAIVTIDPATGHILTMASSAKYADSEYNLAVDAKRQPGSTFKVITLVAAVRAGINPETATYASGPVALGPKYNNVVINCYGGKCAGGDPNLVTSTLRSDNTAYVRLAQDLGFDKVVKAAKDLGITSPVDANPSGTLGGLTNCCSPLEMANAYATVASGGYRNTPEAITEVKFPDGKVDDLGKPQRVRAFDSGDMSEVQKILQLNIKEGTGTRAATGCPVGGKTGTTDKNTDAWFDGFSPKLATAVWVGFPQGKIPMGNLFHGAPVDGGTFPAQIWGTYMKLAARGYCKPFPKPTHPFKPKGFKGHNQQQSYQQAAPIDPNIDPKTGKPKTTETTAAPPPPAATTPATPPAAVTPPPPPPATGGGGYDPDLYDPNATDNSTNAPPLPPPKDTSPP